MMETRRIDEIVWREDLYPRFKPNPAKIQEYSENIDRLPPIEIDQHNILIDGYHRLKAHETVKAEEISVVVTEVKSEAELERLSVERNSTHGQQLTQDEKKSYAVKWWDVLSVEEICSSLSISEKSYKRWTSVKQDQKEEQTKQRIYDMWMSCHTQQEIADVVCVDPGTVSRKIADFLQNGQLSFLQEFRNFEPEVYTTWSFGKATNEVKHFGNIPPEIIDNLLYYYTKPFDIVFDPFGGGGSTIDKCLERKRRYYVSDLTPIPARNDIRQWDITHGLPPDLPVPDLVFLDPPYWKQAEEKYSDKDTDLANIPLDKFIENIGELAKNVKRKWNGSRPDGKLAIIIGPYQKDWQTTDLPFMCYQAITKYLTPHIRIQVPYSTQVHGGQYVQNAKDAKQMLYLSRDLMVFKP
jgi:16S rRNA G966 N2-methylase RsmD